MRYTSRLGPIELLPLCSLIMFNLYPLRKTLYYHYSIQLRKRKGLAAAAESDKMHCEGRSYHRVKIRVKIMVLETVGIQI